MNIWKSLGFGNQNSDDAPVEPSSVDNVTNDITSSHEVIHNSSGDQYWDEFELAIKRLTARELNSINYRLGAGVPDNSDWHEYLEAFRMYQWFRFCEAYHYATRETFSV